MLRLLLLPIMVIVLDYLLIVVTSPFRVKLDGDPGTTVSVSVTKESGIAEITVAGGANLSDDSANWNTWQPPMAWLT